VKSPPGPGSDAGETPSDTALREAREEVGINESVVASLDGSAHRDPGGSFGHLARHRILGRTTRHATDPAEVDRAFTVPSPSCSPKGLSSKSGGDVNWLDGRRR